MDRSEIRDPRSEIERSEMDRSAIRDPRSEIGSTRLLVIRMEDLTRSITPAMKDFMNLDDFPPRKENRADQKYYSHVAALFKQKPLPDWYLEAMYSTPYAQHFYTPEEIETLRKKWSH